MLIFGINSIPYVQFGVLWWYILTIRGYTEYFAALIGGALALLLIRRVLLPLRRVVAFHCCRLAIASGVTSLMELGVWKCIALANPFRFDSGYGDRFSEYLPKAYGTLSARHQVVFLRILSRIEGASHAHVALIARDIKARIEGCDLEFAEEAGAPVLAA